MIWFNREIQERDPAAMLLLLTLLDERERIHAELERITRELDEQIGPDRMTGLGSDRRLD
jgi:hypothetical protein